VFASSGKTTFDDGKKKCDKYLYIMVVNAQIAVNARGREKQQVIYILQTSHLATLDFRERRYICAVLIFFFLLNLLNLRRLLGRLLKKNLICSSAQSARLI